MKKQDMVVISVVLSFVSLVFAVAVLLCGCDECSVGESKCVEDKVFECADGRWQESLDCGGLIESWTCCEDTDGEADCGECE